jgi:hypothetical protein
MKLHVEKIQSKIGKEFIKKHHYSHGCHNGPMTWGLFNEEILVGVIAFATPCSENVRKSVFGEDYKNNVTELHRLVLFDEIPKNSESYFIRASLKLLREYRPNIYAVLSFADSTENHTGVIYQASSAFYTGTTSKSTFFLDKYGRLHHPRQNGVNISKEEAIKREWKPVKREAKHRYLFILPKNLKRKKLLEKLKLKIMEYPNE